MRYNDNAHCVLPLSLIFLFLLYFIAVYVNSLITLVKDMGRPKILKKILVQEFEIRELGVTFWFLGMGVRKLGSTEYQSAIGYLMHGILGRRLDICYVAAVLGLYNRHQGNVI